jgi:replicative superfamily II helicase
MPRSDRDHLPRRRRPATAVRRVLLVCALIGLLAGCEGEGDEAVARVGKQTITKKRLEQTVEHFEEEAQREGKEFPDEGTADFAKAEDRLLALLVYRAELADKAESMGLEVDDETVKHRLDAGGDSEEEEGKEGKAFARDSIRAQLLYEAIYRKVTAQVEGVSPAAAARRNRIAQRFIERMQHDYANKVRYEPGYEPGS